tara:strand:- start:1803 stop:2345 length:543 start_codon:yes stop_codon:yes gene_type:complete
MATVNLLPNANVPTVVNDWSLSTGSDVYALIDDDHTGTVATDSSYLSSTSAGSTCTVELQDFSESHSAINSITLVTKAGNNGRGASFTLETKLTSPSGDYYTESSGSQAAHRNYRTQTYTTRTTHDGSNAWTNALLNSLRVRVDLDAHSGGTTRFTYCYVTVDYDLPVATDNSIFFGTNF